MLKIPNFAVQYKICSTSHVLYGFLIIDFPSPKHLEIILSVRYSFHEGLSSSHHRVLHFEDFLSFTFARLSFRRQARQLRPDHLAWTWVEEESSSSILNVSFIIIIVVIFLFANNVNRLNALRDLTCKALYVHAHVNLRSKTLDQDACAVAMQGTSHFGGSMNTRFQISRSLRVYNLTTINEHDRHESLKPLNRSRSN